MSALIGNQIGPRQLELPPKRPDVDSAGIVLDLILLAVDFEYVRVFLVVAGDRAYPVIAQELVFVEHLREHAPELVFIQYGRRYLFAYPSLSGGCMVASRSGILLRRLARRSLNFGKRSTVS